jgi:hypothetical protein
MSGSNEHVGYMVVIHDSTSDSYSFALPDETDVPQVVYSSFEEAKTAVKKASENFEEFIPVAYGQAYPYDSVTFDQQINKAPFAPYGWGIVDLEDGTTVRICMGLLRITIH